MAEPARCSGPMASPSAAASRRSAGLDDCPPSKGNLSVPPPDRVEAASCFPAREAGRNPVPSAGQCCLILVPGGRPVVQTDGGREKLVVLG